MNPATPIAQRQGQGGHGVVSRRSILTAMGAIAVAPLAAPLAAQQATPSPTPARDWARQEPVPYPDPDIVALDNRFARYIVRNTAIRRLHVGTHWAEGPAWNGVGRYLVWSDIPSNVQLRWIEETIVTIKGPEL